MIRTLRGEVEPDSPDGAYRRGYDRGYDRNPCRPVPIEDCPTEYLQTCYKAGFADGSWDVSSGHARGYSYEPPRGES